MPTHETGRAARGNGAKGIARRTAEAVLPLALAAGVAFGALAGAAPAAAAAPKVTSGYQYGCWHEGKYYPHGSVARVNGLYSTCVNGSWVVGSVLV